MQDTTRVRTVRDGRTRQKMRIADLGIPTNLPRQSTRQSQILVARASLGNTQGATCWPRARATHGGDATVFGGRNAGGVTTDIGMRYRNSLAQKGLLATQRRETDKHISVFQFSMHTTRRNIWHVVSQRK